MNRNFDASEFVQVTHYQEPKPAETESKRVAPRNLIKHSSLGSTSQLPNCFNNTVLRSSSLESVEYRRSSVENIPPRNDFHGAWVYKESPQNECLKFFSDRILRQHKSREDHKDIDHVTRMPLKALT